jgi:riboflavin synthase
MFTGIIQNLGKVTRFQKSSQALELSVSCEYRDLIEGESIAVNGVCLTHTGGNRAEAHFFVSPETLFLTNLGSLQTGKAVNLERALKLQDTLSGHLVQGHVDGMGKITSIRSVGEAYELVVELPADLERYCVVKGSICLNGVSLTLNRLAGNQAEIMLIPHTWNHTQFSTAATGDAINIEVDVLAKYVEKLCRPYQNR